MIVVRRIAELPETCRGGALTIGNFDGVHRGHARILEQLRAMAARVGGSAVVFTFDPHPLTVLRPAEAPAPLVWTERKLQLLERQGIDVVVVYPTDAALLQLTPEAFFDQIVQRTLAARGMVEGPNFHFGRGRSGNVALLEQLCASHALACEVVAPCEWEGDWVSSSRVRELVLAGRIGLANQLLTEPFRLRGNVVCGAQRGRTLGFPTANIQVHETLLPSPGVYAGRARLDRGTWPAAVNIGPNPTFGEQAMKVEVHVCGYTGDLYGSALEVELLDRLRSVQTFSSREELVDQLRRDVAEVSELCSCGSFPAPLW